jgi:hypothetical protein
MLMRTHRCLSIGLVALASFLIFAGCGKSEEKSRKEAVDLSKIAAQSLGVISLDEEAADIKTFIEEAGFSPGAYQVFPSEQMGKHGRTLTYADSKGSSGGLVYLLKTDQGVVPEWHWYFADMVPDSVIAEETNNDGLWDIRIVSTQGKVLKLIQNDTFTLAGKPRVDWLALNGTSSPPADSTSALWKCFDGDSLTAWSSKTSSDHPAFIEVQSPFGVKQGTLLIETLATGQPHHITVFADGKKLQELDLEQKAATQMTQLDPGAKGAKAVKVVFNSVYGNGGIVSLAALDIR